VRENPALERLTDQQFHDLEQVVMDDDSQKLRDFVEEIERLKNESAGDTNRAPPEPRPATKPDASIKAG
jgi:hypothetical protein